jgi:Na+/H+ antiporter NhaD/arsenite permease-like protein
VIDALNTEANVRFWSTIKEDWRMKLAVIFVLLMIAFFIFNLVSSLPREMPIIGVFTYAMVPLLFIAGAINFILLVFSSRKKDSHTDAANEK